MSCAIAELENSANAAAAASFGANMAVEGLVRERGCVYTRVVRSQSVYSSEWISAGRAREIGEFAETGTPMSAQRVASTASVRQAQQGQDRLPYAEVEIQAAAGARHGPLDPFAPCVVRTSAACSQGRQDEEEARRCISVSVKSK